MADLICFMKVNFALPAADVIFATDAQGGNDDDANDAGGFGIVAADLTSAETLECWKSSFQPGKAVCKLDGSLGARFSTRSSLEPTIPFSRMPAYVFDKDWKILMAGRWRYDDHITAGEGRAHWKCLQALAAAERTHGHRVILLQDNFPISCAMSKGRSTAPLVNYYCRRRAATNLAAELYTASPWCESASMPADQASRLSADEIWRTLHHGRLVDASRAAAPRPAHQEQYSASIPGTLPKVREAVRMFHH